MADTARSEISLRFLSSFLDRTMQTMFHRLDMNRSGAQFGQLTIPADSLIIACGEAQTMELSKLLVVLRRPISFSFFRDKDILMK